MYLPPKELWRELINQGVKNPQDIVPPEGSQLVDFIPGNPLQLVFLRQEEELLRPLSQVRREEH